MFCSRFIVIRAYQASAASDVDPFFRSTRAFMKCSCLPPPPTPGAGDTERSSHGQVPGKPFFAAYGLQYSGNGRHGSGMGSSTSRSGNMSPYRSRPSSSTGPPPTGTAGMVAVGRPSTSQTQQRVSGAWAGLEAGCWQLSLKAVIPWSRASAGCVN
jgi:hypothetical protein